ncbi:hypothetical protein RB195_022227 [Necator americanus]|uniref:Uncharacterized protein n=1 Tax=Necator americanus TaxID=51031 RepID=A0ABR1EEG3_NECAM
MRKWHYSAEQTSDNDSGHSDLRGQMNLINASTFKRKHRSYQLTWQVKVPEEERGVHLQQKNEMALLKDEKCEKNTVVDKYWCMDQENAHSLTSSIQDPATKKIPVLMSRKKFAFASRQGPHTMFHSHYWLAKMRLE